MLLLRQAREECATSPDQLSIGGLRSCILEGEALVAELGPGLG
jgi:hypothetical protein